MKALVFVQGQTQPIKIARAPSSVTTDAVVGEVILDFDKIRTSMSCCALHHLIDLLLKFLDELNIVCFKLASTFVVACAIGVDHMWIAKHEQWGAPCP